MKMMKKAPVLPSEIQTVHLLLQLEAPYLQMAWIMLETACRFANIQALRVRDVIRSRMEIHLVTECGDRSMTLSGGLMESLTAYVDGALRAQFETQWRERRRAGSKLPMFADQLLFPAWMLSGYETVSLETPIPAEDYVAALQAAAERSECHAAIHSNTLRLVCAKRWLNQGAPATDIHQRLGHRDLMTTLLLIESLRAGSLRFTGSGETRLELQNPAPAAFCAAR